MKILFTGIAFFGISLFASAQLPYNPDQNNDQVINGADLTSFLSVYGGSFLSDGIVPVESGGTGAADAEAARLNLELSYFTDSILNIGGEEQAYGYVSAGLRVIGNVAEGTSTEASGMDSHAEGNSTFASGDFSHSQNRFTVASGTCAHAQGEGSEASGVTAHAEGFGTEASGISAHAEGYETIASGFYSHAQNRFTSAQGTCAHAEGENTIAAGTASHAEGLGTQAIASRSHAGGLFTIADQFEQTAIGRYNLMSQAGALLSVGNGTSAIMRSDAFRVSANGNAMVAGTLSAGTDVVVNGESLMTLITALQDQNAALAAQVEALQLQVDALTQGAVGNSEE